MCFEEKKNIGTHVSSALLERPPLGIAEFYLSYQKSHDPSLNLQNPSVSCQSYLSLLMWQGRYLKTPVPIIDSAIADPL